MILEAEGRVRLAVWDEEKRSFIDLGWHDAAGLRGLTLADYDWSDADEADPIDPR